MKLLFNDFQQLHWASFDTNTAGDALGGRIFGLQNHDLHGTGFHALAAADAVLLVDHVHTGLGILGDGIMLTDLGAFTALDAGHGLCTSSLCNNLNAG